MEKLVYLVPSSISASVAEALGAHLPGLGEHTRGLTALAPAVTEGVTPSPYAAILCAWFACLDRRVAFEHALSNQRVDLHGYLVTESVVHGAGLPISITAEVSLVVLQQAPQLGPTELRAKLMALSPILRAKAATRHVVRDYVVRPLQTSCPPLRALYTIAHGPDLTLSELDRIFDGVSPSAQRASRAYVRRVVRARAL